MELRLSFASSHFTHKAGVGHTFVVTGCTRTHTYHDKLASLCFRTLHPSHAYRWYRCVTYPGQFGFYFLKMTRQQEAPSSRCLSTISDYNVSPHNK